MKKYTVAEFAEKAGISKQAVYKKIDSENFKVFVSYEDGKTYIDERALNLVAKYNSTRLNEVEQLEVETAKGQEGETAENNSEKEVEQSNAKAEQPLVETVEQPSLQALINQLEKKDEQIAFLQQQLDEAQKANREKDAHIMEQGTQLARLLEQANNLNQNNQILIGMKEQSQQNIVENEPMPAEPTETGIRKAFRRIFRR